MYDDDLLRYSRHLLLDGPAIDDSLRQVTGAACIRRGAAVARIQSLASGIAVDASGLASPAPTSDQAQQP